MIPPLFIRLRALLPLVVLCVAGALRAQTTFDDVTITGNATLSNVTANTVIYSDASKILKSATIGGNLSFSAGTLNLSSTPNIGAATGTSLALGNATHNTTITDNGTASNITVTGGNRNLTLTASGTGNVVVSNNLTVSGAGMQTFNGTLWPAYSTDVTAGADLVRGRYSNSGASSIVTLGAVRSTGDAFLGYGVKAATSSTDFLSSHAINLARGVVRVGGTTSPYFAVELGAQQTSTDGGAVTLAEAARITPTTTTLAGNLTVSGSSVVVGASSPSANSPYRAAVTANSTVAGDITNTDAGTGANASWHLVTDTGTNVLRAHSIAHSTWPGKLLLSSPAAGAGVVINTGGAGDPIELYTNNNLRTTISDTGVTHTGNLTVTGGLNASSGTLLHNSGSAVAGELLLTRGAGNKLRLSTTNFTSYIQNGGFSDSRNLDISSEASGVVNLMVGGATKFAVSGTGVAVNSTSVVTGIRTATATLDFGSISAGAQADLTITVTGAATGDSVAMGLPAAPAAGIVFNAFVSSSNTVTVRASNISGSPVDPASASYRVTVTSF